MIDSDLMFLTKYINETKRSFGVTLFIRGAIINGWIISGSEYYSAVLERLEGDGEEASPYTDYFEKMKEQYTGDKLKELEVHSFLHLSNVKIKIDNGSFKNIVGSCLRVKLEEIDGYMIGAS